MFASTIAMAAAQAALVTATFGTTPPPDELRVPPVVDAPMNTVHFYDKVINVTNRVLDRSIRADIVRVHTDLNTGEVQTPRAKHNLAAVEEHCQNRLEADGISNPTMHCGAGFVRN